MLNFRLNNTRKINCQNLCCIYLGSVPQICKHQKYDSFRQTDRQTDGQTFCERKCVRQRAQFKHVAYKLVSNILKLRIIKRFQCKILHFTFENVCTFKLTSFCYST